MRYDPANRTLPSKDELAAQKEDPLFVESVAKAMRVLEAFSDMPKPLSLSRLASAAGVSKSAAQRISHTLSRLGYLEQTNSGLVPGRRLLERTHDYLRATPLVRDAIPVLADLRRTVQERVDLSLFDGETMIYLVRMQSKRDTFHAHLIGRRVPTFCSSGGRAVLAQLSEETALDIVKRSTRHKITSRTATDVDEVMQSVAAARKNGFALALEQVVLGELAVGAAILDGEDRPIAAIHVVASLAEWDPEEFVRRNAPLAIAAARGISVT